MADVTLFSEIPASHAGKSAIEEAAVWAFEGAGGAWVVSIRPARRSWWTVAIEGADGSHRTIFVEGPDEQNAAFLYESIREALRDARAIR